MVDSMKVMMTSLGLWRTVYVMYKIDSSIRLVYRSCINDGYADYVEK